MISNMIPQNVLEGWEVVRNGALDEINKIYEKEYVHYGVGNPFNAFIDFLFSEEAQKTWVARWCDPEYRHYRNCPLTARDLIANFHHYYVDDGIFHFFICDVVAEHKGVHPPFFIAHTDGAPEEIEKYVGEHFPQLNGDSARSANEMVIERNIERGREDLNERYLRKIEALNKKQYRKATLEEWLAHWPVFREQNDELVRNRDAMLEKWRTLHAEQG